jgi:hypothetical protein
VLVALAAGASPQSDAKTKTPKKIIRPASQKQKAIARSCGAKTLPSQQGDEFVGDIDVDRDGAADRLVQNKRIDAVRIAFANGPEVSIPALMHGQWQRIALYRFAPDQKVFGLQFSLVSSGFYAVTTSLHRRSGCEFVSISLPSDPPIIITSTSKTNSGLGPYDELQCLDDEIVRNRWTFYRSGSDLKGTSTLSTWNYRYSSGTMAVISSTIDAKLPGEFHPPGKSCFFDPLEASRKWI